MASPHPEIMFDPYSKTYFDDPYDLYRRMREERPVLHNEQLGFYALSRWDDVVEGLREPDHGRPPTARPPSRAGEPGLHSEGDR
jgi:hypothetical protein